MNATKRRTGAEVAPGAAPARARGGEGKGRGGRRRIPERRSAREPPRAAIRTARTGVSRAPCSWDGASPNGRLTRPRAARSRPRSLPRRSGLRRRSAPVLSAGARSSPSESRGSRSPEVAAATGAAGAPRRHRHSPRRPVRRFRRAGPCVITARSSAGRGRAGGGRGRRWGRWGSRRRSRAMAGEAAAGGGDPGAGVRQPLRVPP